MSTRRKQRYRSGDNTSLQKNLPGPGCRNRDQYLFIRIDHFAAPLGVRGFRFLAVSCRTALTTWSRPFPLARQLFRWKKKPLPFTIKSRVILSSGVLAGRQYPLMTPFVCRKMLLRKKRDAVCPRKMNTGRKPKAPMGTIQVMSGKARRCFEHSLQPRKTQKTTKCRSTPMHHFPNNDRSRSPEIAHHSEAPYGTAT